MRISDWSSDVCSSDLIDLLFFMPAGMNTASINHQGRPVETPHSNDRARQILITAHDRYQPVIPLAAHHRFNAIGNKIAGREGKIHTKSTRSEEHTSELQSLMRNSYAVFCLQKK